MPTKFTQTTQVISIPQSTSYRLVISNPIFSEPTHNGSCVERRASSNSTYTLTRPPSPLGLEDGIPMRWYRRQYDSLYWDSQNTDVPTTEYEIPSEYRKITYTNGRHRTNSCQHIKLKLEPGELKPSGVENRSFSCGGAARRYRTTASFKNPYMSLAFHEFWEDLTKSGRTARYPKVSFGDLTDQILNPYNQELLNFVGEINQLPSLLTGVSRNARLLKQGIGRVRTVLRGLPIRNPAKAAKAFPKHVASAYLELQFGYKPVADDLAKVIAFTGPLLSHLRNLVDRNGKLRRANVRRSGEYRRTFKVGNFDVTQETTWVSRATICVRVTIPGLNLIYAPLSDKLSQARLADTLYRLTREYYGLSRTPRRLWNLVPLSFLVDQIVPVADYLNDVSSARMGISYVPVYHSLTYKETTTYKLVDPHGSSCTIHLTYFSRKPGSMTLFSSRGWFSLVKRFSATNAAFALQKIL